jgi:GalNAc-alpha-(1->4)-GalNAc-alpha-(1->3)-diNAcBac-PP-undecaprenol alpha-1,4-N-acetyl-D-galactosaminyltransferase
MEPNNEKTVIALFTPTLVMGGTERVVSILLNKFSSYPGVEVHLILCSRQPLFYHLDDSVIVHYPKFDYENQSRWVFTPRLIKHLRKTTVAIRPDVILSFGGRYNSFTIISLFRTRIPVYISERSMPGISYGYFLNLINPLVYRFSKGILAQTSQSASYLKEKTGHANISVIGNPIPQMPEIDFDSKEKIIISVGRFIKSKNHERLISIFSSLPESDWHLYMVGDGPTLDACKKVAGETACSDRIHFAGRQQDLNAWYRRARVFAFVSESEGFPNALAEAMAGGCVPVSYNCVAGPSDLIRNGENGFLVPLHDEKLFTRKLQLLLFGKVDWLPMAKAAADSVRRFCEEDIARETFQFLTGHRTDLRQ